MTSNDQFESWFIAKARRNNPMLKDWSDTEVKTALMAPRYDATQALGSYAAADAQDSWEAWQAARETVNLTPVAWINSYTLHAMQAATKTERDRWPVVKLSQWQDKANYIGLCVSPTA